jgi:ribosomal protein L40E
MTIPENDSVTKTVGYFLYCKHCNGIPADDAPACRQCRYGKDRRKGVEDETFACGTGIVASCIASYLAGVEPAETYADGRVHYAVNARRDTLAVDFMPGIDGLVAEDVWLTGPATFVAEVII